MNACYEKARELHQFPIPYDGAKMMHYLLQKNNYNLILRIAKYKRLDEIDTEELLIKYWKSRYYIPYIRDIEED